MVRLRAAGARVRRRAEALEDRVGAVRGAVGPGVLDHEGLAVEAVRDREKRGAGLVHEAVDAVAVPLLAVLGLGRVRRVEVLELVDGVRIGQGARADLVLPGVVRVAVDGRHDFTGAQIHAHEAVDAHDARELRVRPLDHEKRVNVAGVRREDVELVRHVVEVDLWAVMSGIGRD